MKDAIRPAIFKWRQTAPALILCAVRWYLFYLLSLGEVEALLAERNLGVDHTTIWRWAQRYGTGAAAAPSAPAAVRLPFFTIQFPAFESSL